MLKIRLQRVGRRNSPYFRIIVTDSKNGPKSGKSVELLGSYNPHNDTVQVKGDRVKHWLSVGAQVSDTVHNILVGEKIIEGAKKNVLPKKHPIKKEGEEAAEGESGEEAAASDAATEEPQSEEPKKDDEGAAEESDAGEKQEEAAEEAPEKN